MLSKIILISSVYNTFWDAVKFIERNPITSTLYYVGLVWFFYLVGHLFSILSSRTNPSLKISKLDFIKENPEKKWLLDLQEKNPDLAEYYWYWQQDFKMSKNKNQILTAKYEIGNRFEAEEIAEAISSYNNYMNADVDQTLIKEYNDKVQDAVNKWKSKNESNTLGGRFRDVDDLFMNYYNARATPREDGWLEKTFAQNSKLKNIWKGFDRSIKNMERHIDAAAIPYLAKNGIKIPVFDGKPEWPQYFNNLVSTLSKYKRA